MHCREKFSLAAGIHTLFYDTEDHHINQDCFLWDVIGREEFHLCLVREAWPKRAEGWVEQDSIIDHANGIGFRFMADTQGQAQIGVGIIGLLGTKRYTYETAKGVIRRAGFDFYLARSIDLADVVDV